MTDPLTMVAVALYEECACEPCHHVARYYFERGDTGRMVELSFACGRYMLRSEADREAYTYNRERK